MEVGRSAERSKLPAWVIVVAAIVGSAAAAIYAAGAIAVGVVSEYSPIDARYFLTRSGDTRGSNVVLRIGTVVMTGDEIIVPANGAVTLSLAEGPPRRIPGPAKFRVPVGADVRVGRWLRAFKEIFDVEYRTASTAVTRGSGACEPSAVPAPIVAPILRDQARVVAGVRDLPVAWTGGCPPYAVVVQQGVTVLARQTALGRPQTRLDNLLLEAGTTYTVTITDSRGGRRAVGVAAVEKAPTPPADLLRELSPLGVIARAVWLADQDGGRWRLDAFEILRPQIRSGDPLAGRAGDVLLWQNAAVLLDPVQ